MSYQRLRSGLLIPKAASGGALPTVVNSVETAYTANGISIAVTNPTNISGDQLLYFIAVQGTSFHDTPTGLTRVGEVKSTVSGNAAIEIFRKTSGGSEPSTVTFDSTGGTFGDRCAVAMSIRNAQAAPTLGTDNPTTGTTITALSLNATKDAVVIEAYVASWALTKAGADHLMTANWVEMALVFSEGVAAGATGDQTATVGTSDAVDGRQMEMVP